METTEITKARANLATAERNEARAGRLRVERAITKSCHRDAVKVREACEARLAELLKRNDA